MIDVRDSPEEWALAERALRLTQGFARWPSLAMEQLLSVSSLGRYSRGEVISSVVGPREMLAVVSGHIVNELDEATRSRSIIALLGPSYVFGFSRSLDGEMEGVKYTLRALDDAVIIHMPTGQLLNILDEDPILWQDMAKMLIKEFRQVMESLLILSVGSFQHRLSATIERLAILHGTKEGEEIRIRLRLTQDDLAALLRVTRQSVNKELGELESRGAISWNYNIITVLDLNALRARGGHVA
ncbi:Crp/Fnr family transcriptional regulator [Variovorax sp. W6]|uniref:Crp/Fnr family transcriptional regulator n=1 Tax=Variovorax sp. W6 TaxID=3093895 RepID=UPI003D801802